MCTFIFAVVILMVKGKNTGASRDGVFVALCISLTLYALILISYHAGACFNPAVAVGSTTLQLWQLDNTNGYLSHYFYAYTLGPLAGGLLAGIFFRVHEQCHEELLDDQSSEHSTCSYGDKVSRVYRKSGFPDQARNNRQSSRTDLSRMSGLELSADSEEDKENSASGAGSYRNPSVAGVSDEYRDLSGDKKSSSNGKGSPQGSRGASGLIQEG